jgi:hypothetical protein
MLGQASIHLKVYSRYCNLYKVPSVLFLRRVVYLKHSNPFRRRNCCFGVGISTLCNLRAHVTRAAFAQGVAQARLSFGSGLLTPAHALRQSQGVPNLFTTSASQNSSPDTRPTVFPIQQETSQDHRPSNLPLCAVWT